MSAVIPSVEPALRSAVNAAQRGPVRATIIMTARERYGLTESAIESIVRNTNCGYRLIFADGQAPEPVRRRLEARADEWNLELVRVDAALWPNQIRRQLVAQVDTDYVVFIDNDVQVEAGWLETLIACADESGGGVVGPLYLIGDGKSAPRVHMAGGDTVQRETATGTVLEETHRHLNSDPALVTGSLARRECDFVEYHCLLVRGDLVRDGSAFDPDIVCVHEHIDLSLTAKQRGYVTVSEPKARVTYLGLAEWSCDEVAFRRRRWSWDAAQASIAAFCRKWRIADDDRSFGPVRKFLRIHIAAVDPFRAGVTGEAELAQPMALRDVPQSRSALLDLALARGCQTHELAFLAQIYQLAATLMDGGYRPCGRPFINHLVGTAGVLAYYGFRLEVVAAGLLHAAYSHCPPLPTGPRASIDMVCAALGGRDTTLESRVRAYTRRGMDLSALAGAGGTGASLSVADGEIVAIAAANEIDMLVSGEFRYSGRGDALKPPAIALIDHVCGVLGVPGLAATLRIARAAYSLAPPEVLTGIGGSYRIAGYDLVPMNNNAFFQLEQG
jgi:hypothetical protein